MSEMPSKYVGTLLMTADRIFKVAEENLLTFSGFDIMTEEAVTVKKGYCMVMPASVIKLLSSERGQLMVAIHSTRTIKEAAKLLRRSDRTVFRMINSHIENHTEPCSQPTSETQPKSAKSSPLKQNAA